MSDYMGQFYFRHYMGLLYFRDYMGLFYIRHNLGHYFIRAYFTKSFKSTICQCSTSETTWVYSKKRFYRSVLDK